MEQQFGRPGGIFTIFRILPYLQYFLYIAIGLLIISIVLWVIFAKKKPRWAKVLAIILTILVVVTGALGAVSLLPGMNMQQRGFQERGIPDGFERDGQRMKDGGNINKGNEILNHVIKTLSSSNRTVIII